MGIATTSVSTVLNRVKDRPHATAIFDFDGTIIGEDVTEKVFEYAIAHDRLTDLDRWPDLADTSPRLEPLRYYATLANIEPTGVPWGHYAGALFLAQVFSGLTVRDIRELTDCISPDLTMNSDVLDLLAQLQQRESNIHIISAGLTWCVRRFVHSTVNPALLSRGVRPLDLTRIHAVSSVVSDRGTPRLDRQLTQMHGSDYLQGSGSVVDRLTITPFAGGTITFAGGKVAILAEHGIGDPTIAVGDGLADALMLARATIPLAVGSPSGAAALAQAVHAIGGAPTYHLVGDGHEENAE